MPKVELFYGSSRVVELEVGFHHGCRSSHQGSEANDGVSLWELQGGGAYDVVSSLESQGG